MKTYIAFLIVSILTSVSFTQNLSGAERGNRAGLSIRLANFVSPTFNSDLAAFAELQLTEKDDLELVKNVLKSLIVLENTPEADGGDRSRTSLDVIADSYLKNTAIYEKAIKSLSAKNNKNEKALKEYKEILSRKSPVQ